MFNEPKWVDVNVKGEETGIAYFGRFSVKPFLNHAEKADAARLAGVYCRGIDDERRRYFLSQIAFLKFHVVDGDAKWWKENEGLSALDEEPFFNLAKQILELRASIRKINDPAQQEASLANG